MPRRKSFYRRGKNFQGGDPGFGHKEYEGRVFSIPWRLSKESLFPKKSFLDRRSSLTGRFFVLSGGLKSEELFEYLFAKVLYYVVSGTGISD
mgnify:CR=1 FL=1